MTLNAMENEGKRVKSVQRAFEVIDVLQETGSLHITDLANALDIPESTAHVYLKTLESVGYVVQANDGYELSMRFLQTGIVARQREPVYVSARSEVNKLAEKTGEVANLGIEEDGFRVILYQSEGSEAVYDNAPVGEYSKMHWTALGKAILAEQSPDCIHRIIDVRGLPESTVNTITDPDELFAALDSISDRGYALEDEERREGIRSVAVPLIVDDDLVGALSLSGPKGRFRTQRIENELLPALRNATNVTGIKYTYD